MVHSHIQLLLHLGLFFQGDIYLLSSGNYTITVSDINGCSTTKSINIPKSVPLLFPQVLKMQLVLVGSDGNIFTSASGGANPLSYD